MKELLIIAGPCVVENHKVCFEVAQKMGSICQELGFKYIFKSSFKKANRTKLGSFSGLEENKALEILKQETAKQVLETFLLKLEKMPVRDSIGFKDLMKEIQKETGLKGPFLWKPVRVAITGTESGPELPVVVDIFGKEKVISFVKQAIENYI